jgi:hypothetical protein
VDRLEGWLDVEQDDFFPEGLGDDDACFRASVAFTDPSKGTRMPFFTVGIPPIATFYCLFSPSLSPFPADMGGRKNFAAILPGFPPAANSFFAGFAGEQGQYGEGGDYRPFARAGRDGPEHDAQRAVERKQQQRKGRGDAGVQVSVAEGADGQ